MTSLWIRSPLALGLAALAGLSCTGTSAATALDATGLVGTARAATPAVPDELWSERAAGEPLPQGVVPMTSLAPLVKVLKPGVVNIATTSVWKARLPGRSAPGYQDPFEEFFRRFGQPEESERHSLGSGFIINPKGYVITNNHVVEGATSIKVKLADDRDFAAELVGRDSKTDIALLRLKGPEGKDLAPGTIAAGTAVYLGDSDKLEVGDFVLASGNPFGLDHSVSLGIVSAKERNINAGPYDDFVQTDAAINPGNSGGPLFNTRGEVVGVNTAIVGQGIGFAVPINMVKALLPQLVSRGRVVRGWLGVSIKNVTPELARSLSLGDARGALVAGVMSKGPAETAGLKAGDVVVGVNGKPVETYAQLSREVAFLVPGSSAQFALLRDGKPRTLAIKVGERPEDEEAGSEAPEGIAPAGTDRLGLSVTPLAAQRAAKLGLERGVQIRSLAADGPAARAGVRVGDVIIEIQRQPVRTVQDYQSTLASLKTGDMALLRLQRESELSYVAVRVPR